MSQTTPDSQSELLDAAMDLLRARLPAAWTVRRQATSDPDDVDLLITSTTGGGAQALLLVELRSELTSRDVDAFMSGPWRRWHRQTGNQPILVIAPYINASNQRRLAADGINSLDLTGNAWIQVDFPAIFVNTQGASRDPRSSKSRTGITGAKAGAVVRVLVDAMPPYNGAQISRAANVNEGYLSRILDALVDDGLIDRESSGPVTAVDWPALLRRRAQALDLFRRNGSYRFIARSGPTAILEQLRMRQPVTRPPTITGSYAASRLAPIAAPALLVVYTKDPSTLASDLDLLEADVGADTVLIRPDNEVAFTRADPDGGLAWAAPSQIAIDCLSGNGRMPSEGDALVRWMQDNEDTWRRRSISELIPAATHDED